jgi:hypothetical protein
MSKLSQEKPGFLNQDGLNKMAQHFEREKIEN